jgi:hypothetical protein
MSRAVHDASRAADAPERRALRRRVENFYRRFNRGAWEECYALVDPRLRDADRVALSSYAESLRAFGEAYGSVRPWYVRISLHLDARSNKRDARPFAYVYVVWQDAANEFHMFRERWVKDGDEWFTRVAGLVVNRRDPVQSRD